MLPAATGLWWLDMDCVDCLRVSNTRRLEKKRLELKRRLLDVVIEADNLDVGRVLALLEALDRGRQ